MHRGIRGADYLRDMREEAHAREKAQRRICAKIPASRAFGCKFSVSVDLLLRFWKNPFGHSIFIS
jgi:hypothetical protein